jgi:hypothetical protein
MLAPTLAMGDCAPQRCSRTLSRPPTTARQIILTHPWPGPFQPAQHALTVQPRTAFSHRLKNGFAKLEEFAIYIRTKRECSSYSDDHGSFHLHLTDRNSPGTCPVSSVESRNGSVVAVHSDDAAITGRGKYIAWREMSADLDAADQVVLSNAGDLPGKTIADLLKILAILRDHAVGLYLHAEQIDTASTTFALLDIIQAFRLPSSRRPFAARRRGHVRPGKIIGRPTVPHRVRAKSAQR